MASAASINDKKYWVIVADESTALFYTQDTRRSALQKLTTLENAAARTKIGDLISDSGGRSFDSHGQGRHTMTNEKSDPKKHAAIVFAKDIAERINKARHNGTCRDFALIAAPRFLGLLRDALTVSGNAVPFLTVDKDVVGQEPAVIEKLLHAQ
jgi:protein required for attachment to host cells